METFGNIFSDRVDSVRAMMRRNGWDAVIITGSDPHSSEYSAARWHGVEWISGYDGEGDLVITAGHAGLWTDTRYFIQAARQLPGTGIELHKTRVPEQVLIPQWLAENFAGDSSVCVAVDGVSQTIASVREIRDALGDKAVIANAPDLLDSLWQDRPDVPQTPVITLGTELVGQSRTEKIERLRDFITEKGCDAILVTALDEIAWTLNVRGQDVDYNPVVMSYLLVTMDNTIWFVRKGPVQDGDDETESSFHELIAEGINIQDYSDIGPALAEMTDDDYIRRIFADPSTLNYNLFNILKEHTSPSDLMLGRSPASLWKALKNKTEISGMMDAHLADGIAMEKFFFWLETSLSEGKSINEYDAAVKLHEIRSEAEGFCGESFETISAYGPNAALPHYVTPEEGSSELLPEGLYLCDSGGQYLFGTTDITRTVPLGPCSQLEKEDYTLVLKGHIDLAKAVFPEGTPGCRLDVLARSPLWSSLRNFGHGTGHGVGFFLNVHEGPQDIRQNLSPQPMLPGMITSDEPGIYREGLFGIRHENLVLCVDGGSNDFGNWLKFETMTLCHFDTSVIVKELLDASEIEWLDSYNAKVFQTLSPHLPSEVTEWLRSKTKAIQIGMI